MAFLHFVCDSFKYKKKYDDSSKKMSPDIDSLIMYDEKRLHDTFRSIIIESISFKDMLIVLENFRSLVKMS